MFLGFLITFRMTDYVICIKSHKKVPFLSGSFKSDSFSDSGNDSPILLSQIYKDESCFGSYFNPVETLKTFSDLEGYKIFFV